jgi:hypothetical protein
MVLVLVTQQNGNGSFLVKIVNSISPPMDDGNVKYLTLSVFLIIFKFGDNVV